MNRAKYLGLAFAMIMMGLSHTLEASVLKFNLGGSDITPDVDGTGSILAKNVVQMEFSTFTTGVYLDVYFSNLTGVTTESKLESIIFNFKGDLPTGFDIVAESDFSPATGYVSNQNAFDRFDQATKENEFKYGDNGLFDLKIFFKTDNSHAFFPEQAVRLSITANSWNPEVDLFDDLSTDGKFKAAMHILTTDNGNSGHYGGGSGFGGEGDPVPEPGTIAIWSMIGLGAVGGAAWRRRRQHA